MATVSRIPLSGSTHGRGIKVTGTSTGASVTIHTAQATTTDGLGDEVTLWAYNDGTVAVTLTIEHGGTTDPDDTIAVDVPPTGSGLFLVAPGLFIRNALVVKAFASTANVIVLHGHVNRITA
jgi:hypothetical protein